MPTSFCFYSFNTDIYRFWVYMTNASLHRFWLHLSWIIHYSYCLHNKYYVNAFRGLCCNKLHHYSCYKANVSPLIHLLHMPHTVHGALVSHIRFYDHFLHWPVQNLLPKYILSLRLQLKILHTSYLLLSTFVKWCFLPSSSLVTIRSASCHKLYTLNCKFVKGIIVELFILHFSK